MVRTAMPKTKPFRTEVDLCAAFIAAVGDGWTSYAETSSWDILLVRNHDGFQIGIQAKLKLTPFVLAQAIDEYRHQVECPGPDCRAVLVPSGAIPVGLGYLCAHIGITIIRMMHADINPYHPTRAMFSPELPVREREWSSHDWFEQAPVRRCELPEYVPDVAAGASSPVQLTDWKIRALKIVALLEERGFVTRNDFRHLGIDHRRWLARGTEWLRPENGNFVRGPRLPDFKAQHPMVFAKILADAEKWKPKMPATLL